MSLGYDVTALESLAAECGAIIIVGHTRPDGDCIGSAMALGLALKRVNKEVYVCLDEYSERYDIIPGKELLYKSGEIEADVAIAVDCSTADRLGDFFDLYKKARITINIDHHMGNTNFAMSNYVYDDASSTSEIIYHMINNWVMIDKTIATAIYAGLVYDTGGFRHCCTTPEVHRIVAGLMELGIPFTEVYNKIMREHSHEEARALATAIQNIKTYGEISYTYLSQKDINKLSVSVKDLGEIVDYVFMIKGVTTAVFFYEAEDKQIRVSMRSKDRSVNETAIMLGGGGHKLAAGCTIRGSIEDAVEMVLGKLDV